MRHRARPRKGRPSDSSGHEKAWKGLATSHASSIMENVRLTRCGHFFYGYDARIHNGMRDRGWAVRRPLPIAERLRARGLGLRAPRRDRPAKSGRPGDTAPTARASTACVTALPESPLALAQRHDPPAEGGVAATVDKRLTPRSDAFDQHGPKACALKRCGTMAWYAGLPYHACAASLDGNSTITTPSGPSPSSVSCGPYAASTFNGWPAIVAPTLSW